MCHTAQSREMEKKKTQTMTPHIPLNFIFSSITPNLARVCFESSTHTITLRFLLESDLNNELPRFFTEAPLMDRESLFVDLLLLASVDPPPIEPRRDRGFSFTGETGALALPCITKDVLCATCNRGCKRR